MNAAHRALVALCAVAVTSIASANDRPFQVARTAVWEDDSAKTFSFESWIQRLGPVRGLSIEPEYDFGGGRSVQVELGRLVDRTGDETGHEAEIEFKQIFGQVEHDGWAWAVSASAGAERSRSDGTVRHLNLKLPVSIALGKQGYLHLNAGIDTASGSRRRFAPSAVVEHRLFEGTMGFVEVARGHEGRFAQIGTRNWLIREKLAFDIALQQRRTEGRRQSGVILGLGVYDF